MDAQEGTHNIILQVRDSKGATTNQTFTLVINNAPPTIATLTGSFMGTPTTALAFTGSGTDPGGDLLTYTWNWGDGTANQSGANLTNVTHAYTTAGIYTLTLTVADGDGASVSRTQTITIGVSSNPPHSLIVRPLLLAQKAVCICTILSFLMQRTIRSP